MAGRLSGTGLSVLRLTGIACLGVAVAFAEPVRKTFSTAPNPSFQLQGRVGTVAVKAWDQNQIDIQGEAGPEAEVVVAGSEHKVSVQCHAKREGAAAEKAKVDLEILVPRQSTVRLHTDSGQIVVEGVEGGVAVEAISAQVELSQIRGNVTVSTVDGAITIRSSEGHIKADSISGDLKFVQVNAKELRANTNSGAIRYEGDFGMGGIYVLNNYSSVIDILTSAKASFDLTARAVQGLIESSLAFRPIPAGSALRRLSPGKFLQGRFNSGQSTVEVTSYSGTIRLHGPIPTANAAQ